MEELSKGKCKPCEAGVPPMDEKIIGEYRQQVPEWLVEENLRIVREFTFKNFVEALAFVNSVGAIAEEQGHHPDLLLHNWKHVTVTLTTFAINGLSSNDFILAAKIDLL